MMRASAEIAARVSLLLTCIIQADDADELAGHICYAPRFSLDEQTPVPTYYRRGARDFESKDVPA